MTSSWPSVFWGYVMTATVNSGQRWYQMWRCDPQRVVMNKSISLKLMLGVVAIIIIPMSMLFALTSRGIATLSEENFAKSTLGELRQVNNVGPSGFSVGNRTQTCLG